MCCVGTMESFLLQAPLHRGVPAVQRWAEHRKVKQAIVHMSIAIMRTLQTTDDFNEGAEHEGRATIQSSISSVETCTSEHLMLTALLKIGAGNLTLHTV